MADNQHVLRDMLENWAYPDKGSHWHKEHCKAIKLPTRQEKGLLKILEGVAIYGDASVDVGTKVGEDGYAAEYILDILRGVVGLLSAETGRLDCGTVDKAIRALGENLGFNRDLTE